MRSWESKYLIMATMITLSCSNCGISFQRSIGQCNAAKKRGDKNQFCSSKCGKLFIHEERSIKISCFTCSKVFQRNKSEIRGERLFCSSSCSAKFNNQHNPRRKPEGHCSICNTQIKTKLKYCRVCKKTRPQCDLTKTLQYYIDKSISTNIASTYSTIREHARSVMKTFPKFCTVCGYNKHVETCHLKAISDFDLTATLGEINHISNLTLLCRNCHWEYDHDLLTIEQVKPSSFAS